MAKILVTNIVWDGTEDFEPLEEIPTRVEVEVDDDYTTDQTVLDDVIADKLCDLYGYCPKGFSYDSLVK